MTWREKVVVQILLLVARIIAKSELDPALVAEIKATSIHVSVHGHNADRVDGS